MVIQSLEDELLKAIPSTGKSIGNKALLTVLKNKNKELTDDEYWKARNNLIELGKISKARGKGGAVYLLEVLADTKKVKKVRAKESELYEPFIKVIKEYWINEYGIDDYIVDKTANQGSKSTRGRWTRPDVTLISMKNFQYIYGKIMEVITFEIKPEDSYGVESVFETASQSVFAHKSFLCIHLPSGKPDTEEFERIIRQCELFGVGLLVFEKPDVWETYETVVDPKRKEPDPYEVNLFIKQQLPEKTKEELSKKLK